MSTTGRRVAVIVSGGEAESPFTTPSEACAEGLAAGNTSTALREHLLASGHEVYTAPSRIGGGVIAESPGFGGFAGGPAPLPAEMTVNSTGAIDAAGRNLARFLSHLSETRGAGTVDLVGHSMGGLFARAAIRALQAAGSPLRVASLTTIGTPWHGSFAAEVANGDRDHSVACGDPQTQAILEAFAAEKALHPAGASEQVTTQWLDAGGWNAAQAGVLDGIAVTLIGGDYFSHPDGPIDAWPHDGIVSRASACAERMDAAVLAAPTTLMWPDVHSIFFAEHLGLPWERALTWNPEVLAAVADAIAAAR